MKYMHRNFMMQIRITTLYDRDINKKQLDDVEYFKYLGSLITNDATLHVKLNLELPWQKQHSTKRRKLYTC